jgi:hypothetical protein
MDEISFYVMSFPLLMMPLILLGIEALRPDKSSFVRFWRPRRSAIAIPVALSSQQALFLAFFVIKSFLKCLWLCFGQASCKKNPNLKKGATSWPSLVARVCCLSKEIFLHANLLFSGSKEKKNLILNYY